MIPGLAQRVERSLAGWPDHALTFLLFGLAALAVVVALFAPRTAKLAVAAWMAAP